MKEIGGYIELDTYTGTMLHEKAKALNCGRNCLAFLIEAREIKKIALPFFLCDSVKNLCKKKNVEIQYYHIDNKFLPDDIDIKEDEWLYLVNFYGQLSKDQIKEYVKKYKYVIVDQAQAYFEYPIQNVDTIYTCRKFFGVPDGAFLYTNAELERDFPYDISFERMRFLLGRYEKSASEFYNEYTANNKLFSEEDIKRMSKLTNNLLHGIDYGVVKETRTKNYEYLFDAFSGKNKLDIKKIQGAYAYPLYVENGEKLRKKLIDKKVFVPKLWPNVLNEVSKDSIEYKLADNIIPLPCDQRYGEKEMRYIVDIIYEEEKQWI